MKYSNKNKPLVCMMTHSTCYQNTTTMQVKGVLWHSTGANNPDLKRYIQPYETDSNYNQMIALLGKNPYNNDWNHTYVEAGLNCWIGKLADGTVTTIQTMPWDYRPWGCYKGRNGSCNDGWIQFEICEDGLNDEKYFNEIYQEACEITAYLCKMFNINPKGTVVHNGITVPTILCHRDSYDLGLGSAHADILHWFPKFGKNMKTIRDDVAKLLNTNLTIPNTPEIYRVRKSWTNVSSQIGAYGNLRNAIEACRKAGVDYKVYDNKGNEVYAINNTNTNTVITFQVNDIIRIKPEAKWINGIVVPKWIINSNVYLRDIKANGDYIVSTMPTGPITGVINPQFVYKENTQKHKVKVTADALNVRAAASLPATKIGLLTKDSIVTILETSNGWGKINFNNKVGWISLIHTEKV